MGGRLRHVLHRAVHGHAAKQPGRLQAKLRHGAHRRVEGGPLAGARLDRRECALPSHRPSDQRLDRRPEALRAAAVPEREAFAEVTEGPRVHGGAHLGLHQSLSERLSARPEATWWWDRLKAPESLIAQPVAIARLPGPA